MALGNGMGLCLRYFSLRPPFIFLPAALVVAALERCQCRVPLSGWEVWLEFYSAVEGGNSSGWVTLLLERNAKVVVSLWEVGLEFYSAVEGADSSG